MENSKMRTDKGINNPAAPTPVQLKDTKLSTALDTPFPVTLIRVDRKPQPMTYQFADKTDILSLCNSGKKSNVKVVYTCTPVNSQQKLKTSPVKKEQGTDIACHAGPAVTESRIHPDPSLVKVEPLDDDVLENEGTVTMNIKKEFTGSTDIPQQTSVLCSAQAESPNATLRCTSPLASTLSSPPVLKSISPPISDSHRGNETPPVLTIEPDITDSVKTPANSETASAILKQKLASFVASRRSYTDVESSMPTKFTIQGKTIKPSGCSSCQTPKNDLVDEKPKDNICALTTSGESPVCVAIKPKRQHGKKKKKEGEEMPIYTCNRCMIAFSQDSQLKAHFLSAHTEEEEGSCTSFKCHFCNILFLEKASLTAHLVKSHASKGIVSVEQLAPTPSVSKLPVQRQPPSSTITSQHMSILNQISSPPLAQPTLQKRPNATRVGALEKRKKNESKERLAPLKASNAESCNMCGCLFPYKRSLDIHRLKEHVNIFSPTASVSLDRSETVNLEVEGQNGSSYIQQNVVHKTSFCLSCGFPCKSNSELGKHIYSKHGGKYFCPASGCDRIYHERRCLKLHINSHHPKFRAYSCKSCSFCTYQQLSILRHLDSHVKEPDTIDLSLDDQDDDLESTNVAEEDKGTPGEIQGVDKSGEKEENVDNEETSAPYVYIERLNGEEVVDVPFNPQPPSPPPPSPPPAKKQKVATKSSKSSTDSKSQSQNGFRCLDCKGYFLNRNSLIAHFSSCGSNAPSSNMAKEKPKLSYPSDPMTRSCNLCFQKFKSFAALKSHRRHMHFNHASEDKSLCCFTCGSSFPNSRGLSAHMQLHVKDDDDAE